MVRQRPWGRSAQQFARNRPQLPPPPNSGDPTGSWTLASNCPAHRLTPKPPHSCPRIYEYEYFANASPSLLKFNYNSNTIGWSVTGFTRTLSFQSIFSRTIRNGGIYLRPGPQSAPEFPSFSPPRPLLHPSAMWTTAPPRGPISHGSARAAEIPPPRFERSLFLILALALQALTLFHVTHSNPANPDNKLCDMLVFRLLVFDRAIANSVALWTQTTLLTVC